MAGKKKYHITKDELRYLCEVKKLSQREIAERFGCSRKVVWNRMREYGIASRTYAEAQIIAKGHLDARHPFSDNVVEKGAICGFCQGDVHIRIRSERSLTIELSCCSTVQETLDLFEGMFSKYGHIGKGKPDKQGCRCYIARLDRKSHAYLEKLLAMGDDIPTDVLADPEARLAFFGGYIDAEGCISICDGRARFMLCSYDKNILHHFYDLLVSVGIKCPPPRLARPKGHTNGRGRTLRQDYWVVGIYDLDSLLALFGPEGILGPYIKHPKRTRDIEAAIQNIEERKERAGSK